MLPMCTRKASAVANLAHNVAEFRRGDGSGNAKDGYEDGQVAQLHGCKFINRAEAKRAGRKAGQPACAGVPASQDQLRLSYDEPCDAPSSIGSRMSTRTW